MSLKIISNFSFPGTNLLEISLVQKPQDAYYKQDHFFFLKMSPGVKTPKNPGGRTYVKDNHTTMKLNIQDVLTLGYALCSLATGECQSPYTHFTDTRKSESAESQESGGTKSLMLKPADGDKGKTGVLLFMSKKQANGGNNKPMCFSMDSYAAKSMGHLFLQFGDKAFELEFSNKFKKRMSSSSTVPKVANGESFAPNYQEKGIVSPFELQPGSNVPVDKKENKKSFDADAILEFVGEFFFMSALCKSPILYDGLEYPTLIAYFHAMKTKDNEKRKEFAQADSQDHRAILKTFTVREDWDQIKDKVMEHGLKLKFSNEEFRQKLCKTHPRKLVCGNRSGEKYWGYDLSQNSGQNKMGELLMGLRFSFISNQTHNQAQGV